MWLRPCLCPLALPLAAALLAGCVPHSLESTEVGVRTLKVAIIGRSGVIPEVYPSGATYFFAPLISDWNVYDIGIHNLAMTRSADGGTRKADDSVQFKTFDGNDIAVDITVAWRIAPEKAPYILQFVGPNMTAVEERLVRPVTRTILRDVLNELRSEQYYDADVRFQKADEAREVCNLQLNPEGVIVDQVLLGEHKFNPEYEQVIKDKTIADQEAARLRSETEASREGKRRELEVAKGQVNQTIEQAKGSAEKQKLVADATYYQREREAEALLAEAKARTEGLKAQAKALQGNGGRNMVKIKVAEALAGKPILFLPTGGSDLRTTNMNQILERYGALSAAGRPAPTP